MEIDRVKRVLSSLMILSFLIFGLLAGIIFITDVPLNGTTAALPFVFLFISALTLVITGQIDEHPHLVDKYLREWLFICTFVIVIGALITTLT